MDTLLSSGKVSTRDATLSLDRDLSSRYRVCMGPGKPGKSWNFTLTFSRTGKPRSKTTGPEMLGNLFNLSNKVFRIYIIRNV